MKKTDKKRDNQIREQLTLVCDLFLNECEGFEWLTHKVNYDAFPKSLKVICVFSQESEITAVRLAKQDEFMIQAIQHHLQAVSMNISRDQIVLDSEAACDSQHDGNWARRLN
ncbi:Fis family transcriptional regulator [Shewanella donghaensis]|uniref:Fis family transcriptional regulator n=1 Tax=Shewanella donghaensis TaxID=238836 RepID=UPI001D0523C3|nr:Fis family transcriptional regulator [Shewanella donghaensis]